MPIARLKVAGSSHSTRRSDRSRAVLIVDPRRTTGGTLDAGDSTLHRDAGVTDFFEFDDFNLPTSDPATPPPIHRPAPWRDFTSRSSQSLRMYGTDSFAVLRSSAWSSFDSVSQTFLENTSISGTRECSERL